MRRSVRAVDAGFPPIASQDSGTTPRGEKQDADATTTRKTPDKTSAPVPAGGGVVRMLVAAVLAWLIAYAALISVRPFVEAPHGAAFRAVGNALFGGLSSRMVVRFQPYHKPGANHDTRVSVSNRQTGAAGHIPISSWYLSYSSTALVLSLGMATPLGWRQRLTCMALGMVLSQVYSAARVGILILFIAARPDIGVVHVGESMSAALPRLMLFVTAHVAGVFFFPILLWAIATMRRDNIQLLLARCGTLDKRSDRTTAA